METLVNCKHIFNPISKLVMTTSLIPVCDYQSDTGDEDPVSQRNQFVVIYGDEIISNGGELSISDNGDIMITRNTESLYSNDLSTSGLMTKEYFFNNISTTERDLMSDFEQSNYVNRMKSQILRRYMTEEEQNWIYTDPTKYFEKLKDIQDNTAYVEVSVEATLYSQLEKAFENDIGIVKSHLLEKVFKLIKIRQLSIGAFTDIKTWIYGVARNFYPFCYFKSTGIQDMLFLGTAPKKLSDIDFGTYDPDNKSVYWKEITSVKKNLMTVCKQTNTDYYAIPEGWFKSQQYSSPVNTHIIGNMDGILEGINIEYVHHNDYIEYNVNIDNNIATQSLSKTYYKQLTNNQEPRRWGSSVPLATDETLNWVGTQQQRNSTSCSKFLIDYGFTVPVSRLSVQNQRMFKFTEGPKFVIYWAFSRALVDDPNSTLKESMLFNSIEEYTTNVSYVATAKVWTSKNYIEGGSNHLQHQPLLVNEDFKDDLQMIDKEMWSRQDYYYDETYINDGYVKGDFFYMTGSTQQNSSGFVGITCKVQVPIPDYVCYNPADKAQQLTFYAPNKTFTLRTILSIQDINDAQQIKDTIETVKCDMLGQLYSLLDMYIKRNMELRTTPPGLSIDERIRTVIFYGAMRHCLKDVDFDTERVFFDEMMTQKEKTLYYIFPKTFRILSENIEYFPSLQDVYNSEYAYELKTFSGAQQNNQSYTSNNIVRLSPSNVPFDIRDFTKSSVNITFNALIPSITGEYELGGGFIGKKEYRIQERQFIKYIVSKSKEFTNGLSNSEIVRFDIETFNTEGLDVLYENAFPTKRKEISITLRRMTSSVENTYQENIYLSNDLVTNVVYDHNYLNETDTIRLGLMLYEKD